MELKPFPDLGKTMVLRSEKSHGESMRFTNTNPIRIGSSISTHLPTTRTVSPPAVGLRDTNHTTALQKTSFAGTSIVVELTKKYSYFRAESMLRNISSLTIKKLSANYREFFCFQALVRIKRSFSKLRPKHHLKKNLWKQMYILPKLSSLLQLPKL